MGFLEGKKVLILGLLSDRSIAYGIASAMKKQGAELAFTYQMEKHQGRVEKLAANFDSNLVLPCDVSNDDHIVELFPKLSAFWNKFDILVHSIAFVPKEALDGGVAKKFKIDWKILAKVNQVRSKRTFRKRSILLIPNNNAIGTSFPSSGGGIIDYDTIVTHRVSRGETLSHISIRYNVSVKDIKEFNELRTSRIIIGDVLDIPK